MVAANAISVFNTITQNSHLQSRSERLERVVTTFESFGMIWLLHIRVSNRLYWRGQFLKFVRWVRQVMTRCTLSTKYNITIDASIPYSQFPFDSYILNMAKKICKQNQVSIVILQFLYCPERLILSCICSVRRCQLILLLTFLSG